MKNKLAIALAFVLMISGCSQCNREKTTDNGKLSATLKLNWIYTGSFAGEVLGMKEYAQKNGLDLKIQPGAIVAITGDSISGKSTLLKIILGLYRPQMGVVQLDGQDIRQLDPVEVRQQIAYVPDKMDFFYDSIEQNLLLAKPDATAEHIEEVLKMVGVYEDIMDLPDRLETIMLKNSTATLPREMLQKISLARALLKGANLLMVDDILEELDIASQKVIMQSLKKVAEKRSVILVARQPEILSEVDRIVVMKAGRIVMDGPRAKVLPDLLF